MPYLVLSHTILFGPGHKLETVRLSMGGVIKETWDDAVDCFVRRTDTEIHTLKLKIAELEDAKKKILKSHKDSVAIPAVDVKIGQTKVVFQFNWPRLKKYIFKLEELDLLRQLLNGHGKSGKELRIPAKFIDSCVNRSIIKLETMQNAPCRFTDMRNFVQYYKTALVESKIQLTSWGQTLKETVCAQSSPVPEISPISEL